MELSTFSNTLSVDLFDEMQTDLHVRSQDDLEYLRHGQEMADLVSVFMAMPDEQRRLALMKLLSGPDGDRLSMPGMRDWQDWVAANNARVLPLSFEAMTLGYSTLARLQGMYREYGDSGEIAASIAYMIGAMRLHTHLDADLVRDVIMMAAYGWWYEAVTRAEQVQTFRAVEVFALEVCERTTRYGYSVPQEFRQSNPIKFAASQVLLRMPGAIPVFVAKMRAEGFPHEDVLCDLEAPGGYFHGEWLTAQLLGLFE